jgi:hypothetical protein
VEKGRPLGLGGMKMAEGLINAFQELISLQGTSEPVRKFTSLACCSDAELLIFAVQDCVAVELPMVFISCMAYWGWG